ncbi:hypothetical protein EC973_002400 [Apophysomyces ossiformis]|uniref:Sulfatase N-terminal domain-containing protein n=1 Tax=Apophysomyces ossiformis TaxID=679940 RepID=A0A8H7BIG3_9FUNG|nr:hypothetical protein EC973_002400 [Apophysomyces ossiformis]
MKILTIGSALCLLLQALYVSAVVQKQPSKPNIIFIFTDDQDAKLGSLEYMPNLQKHLVKQGTLYRNHYATIAVCCPSRVGLLRGQYAHNTKYVIQVLINTSFDEPLSITDVSPPHGGYDRFNTLQLGEDYLPIWLQKSGYSTHYIGKLMNQYSVNNYNKPTPKGFDYQDQLVDPYTYLYDTPVFSTDGQAPVYYKDQYQTDIIHAKAREALRKQRDAEKPFFLWVAPTAPHGEFEIFNQGELVTKPAAPAARHAHLFKDAKIPRTPSFNPHHQTKTASFWKTLPKLSNELVEELDEMYRNRLRALQAVDEMIGTIFDELERQDKLDNTYIIYSSDNGYHIGQHRSYPGKCGNIEEDINVPFIVRGPGVPKGKTSDIVSSHHDIAPTLLALAKASHNVPHWVDGGVIPLTEELAKHPNPTAPESFAVEFWALKDLPEFYPQVAAQGPNTYKTLRVIAENYNWMYAVWCTGEHELYDLKQDPYETNNLYSEASVQLVNRLDALLTVLKSCRAETCRDPWRVLHPDDSSVKTLADALHRKHDLYYDSFSKMSFTECLDYYSTNNEVDHFTLHSSLNKTTLQDQQPFQKVVLQETKRAERKEEKPSRCIELFQRVPRPSHPVGHAIPGEDYEKYAIPVPEELIEEPIDWSQYGFYSFGS